MSEFLTFVDDYYKRFSETLLSFDKTPLAGVLEVVDRVTRDDGILWVAGNGGSAAISNHTCCDMTKGTHTEGCQILRCQSLAANVPILTAIGNDIGYDETFSKQVQYYVRPRDALLLVSSSGNSPNVIKACELANDLGVDTIAFVGFGGGKLKDLAKHCVWIPINNYGIVEDAHQSLIHVLSQYIKARSTKPK
ncbi:MAG TPA: SIS domain-containing protein, partial [Polyangiaceae bacterium]|nr:SIS domain-containing protein [Polyangiaceae bacterium]